MILLKSQFRAVAELALARSIPDIVVGGCKPGRLMGLYKKVQDVVVCILEESPYNHNDKVIECLNLIYDYFGRVGKVHNASNWAGLDAARKWEGIIGGCSTA